MEGTASTRLFSLRLLLACALALGGAMVGAPSARAQDAEDEEALEEEASEAAPEEEEEGTPRLRAPDTTSFGRAAPGGAAAEASEEEADAEEEEEEEEVAAEEQLPDPDRTAERLDGAGTDPTVAPWTTPQTVFELHGYMRMRGEFIDQLFLGRGRGTSPSDNDFFAYWQPLDDGAIPEGGCGGGRETAPGGSGSYSACDQNALAFANMRLRVEPTIHLSDDVRVRMQVDFLDNLVMGSTPGGLSLDSSWQRQYGTLVPAQAFATTQDPPIAGINSFSDSVVVRRAWAEVRNRGLGELRFGRMGAHWGLGILFNDGRGIDQDHQTDVDRVMAITRILGIYAFAAWDFASEGMMYIDPSNHSYQRQSFDRVRLDDVDQMVFGVARRLSPEEQQQALARHDAVLNAGALFMYRTQNLTTEGVSNPYGNYSYSSPTFVRRGYESYTADLWVQFLYEDLRLELEAVGIFGTIDNLPFSQGDCTGNPSCLDRNTFVANNGSKMNLLQMGLAFEGEYHLLNDQLGIYFNFGIASGDADQEGLSLRNGSIRQLNRPGGHDRTLSTMYFHPAYRVDLLMYRNLMGQISGSYYFRPGLSYDFIRNGFGQLLGARADVIWSRAVEPVQTWGNQPDLGVEIDAQVYYRSEDGPDLLDGFTVSLMYGILFPLGGLGYGPGDTRTGAGQNAQTLRLLLGVTY